VNSTAATSVVQRQRLTFGRATDQQLTTAAEMPALLKHCSSSSPLAGVRSLGLKTIALPAISAGMMWPQGRWQGRRERDR
jgi:hypothetical protein